MATAIPSPDWDTIEATSIALAMHGCFPVKLCRLTDHKHGDTPCRTPGKVPVDKAWQTGNRETNMPLLLDQWPQVGQGQGDPTSVVQLAQ